MLALPLHQQGAGLGKNVLRCQIEFYTQTQNDLYDVMSSDTPNVRASWPPSQARRKRSSSLMEVPVLDRRRLSSASDESGCPLDRRRRSADEDGGVPKRTRNGMDVVAEFGESDYDDDCDLQPLKLRIYRLELND
jgi:hypothetical protein